MKYRTDTCEATHSYIYLPHPKVFLISALDMWYSMLKLIQFCIFLYLTNLLHFKQSFLNKVKFKQKWFK
jgi:hypothetical protein